MKAFFFFIFLICFVPMMGAQEVDFKIQNPDIGKYDFAKDYIVSLSYYSRISQRASQETNQTSSSGDFQDLESIQKIIHNRILDNTEIRIARNYLLKYKEAVNPLMVTVVNDVISVYDQLLAVSIRERSLWQVLYDRRSGKTVDVGEQDILQEQIGLAEKKKMIAKELIKTSHLLSVILLSAQRCQHQHCHDLALTQKERTSLIEKLNTFALDIKDWGLKPGQTTLQASIAVIREVLEDPLYISKP